MANEHYANGCLLVVEHDAGGIDFKIRRKARGEYVLLNNVPENVPVGKLTDQFTQALIAGGYNDLIKSYFVAPCDNGVCTCGMENN